MQLFLSLFIFILSTSLLMVGYVLIRDIKHKKSLPVELANSGNTMFEEIETEESLLAEYSDLRKKTA